jgi:hypothetical protein
MASTPIYNWPTPDNTDLVKNGALAIRTLGNAIDTTVDTMIPETIFAAKGDLLGASANDTPAVLTVGANGETLVADSSTSTGLRYTGLFGANKNQILNADFRINQRAFSSTTSTGTFMFDRYRTAIDGDGTATFSAQTFTPGAAPVAGYEGINYLRIVTASQTSTAVQTALAQRVEDARALSGQTVTISFWAKASSGTPNIAVNLNQNFGTGGSPSSSVTNPVGKVAISTSWARYSLTYALPSVSGKTFGTNANSRLDVNIWVSAGSDNNTASSTLGIQNNTFEFWGVQLEAGSVATPFQTATGTIQGELAACQRYYYRTTSDSAYSIHSTFGNASSTTVVQGTFQMPVTMRVEPTSIDYATLAVTDWVTTTALTTLTIDSASSSRNAVLLYTGGATGLTQYRPYVIVSNGSTNGYVGISAEL